VSKSLKTPLRGVLTLALYGTIYFNTSSGVDRADKDYWASSRICGFCELPPIYKSYGESLELRLINEHSSESDLKNVNAGENALETQGVRIILTAENLEENGYLPELTKLAREDNHIFTLTSFDYGRNLTAILLEIYSIKLVDD
jgi:hypothetical protein